jgi:DNA-binding NarL/FixJ family response regulator
MSAFQVMVVDSNELSRSGIQLMLTHSALPIELAGSFPDLWSCEAFLKKQHIGMLLLDDKLPRQQSITRIVKQFYLRYPHMKTVVMSGTLNIVYIQSLLDSGAKGFIFKEECIQHVLAEAVQGMIEGRLYLSPHAQALCRYGQVKELVERLNANDLHILHLIARGYTVREIAVELGLVARSIHRSRQRLREVLEVRTNEQIVDAARQRGLLDD